MEKFLKNLQNAFSKSKYELCMKNQKTDLYYQQLEKKYNMLFDDIRNRLGKNRKLMLELEKLQNEIGGIDDDFIYLQGFTDCAALLKLIKLI